MKLIKIFKFSYANLENHENLRILRENYENHENMIILQKNKES